jgi:hypothetical protein
MSAFSPSLPFAAMRNALIRTMPLIGHGVRSTGFGSRLTLARRDLEAGRRVGHTSSAGSGAARSSGVRGKAVGRPYSAPGARGYGTRSMG